jgi:enoyl reductase-like protein
VQTDRTIPKNKPDIVLRDNEKGTCMPIDVAILGDRNVIKKEAEKTKIYKDLTINVQKIPEQHTGKARNQGTTQNSHIGRCTYTAESTNAKVQ